MTHMRPMNGQTPKNYVDVQRHAAETLRKLERLKIKHADSTSTRFERVCNTVSNWMIGTSGVLFLLICGAGFVIGTDEPLTGWVRLVVLSLILLCLLAAFAGLALQIITVVVSVLLYRSTAPELRAAQFSHDIENAKALAGLPAASLDLADDWLGQKIKRNRSPTLLLLWRFRKTGLVRAHRHMLGSRQGDSDFSNIHGRVTASAVRRGRLGRYGDGWGFTSSDLRQAVLPPGHHRASEEER